VRRPAKQWSALERVGRCCAALTAALLMVGCFHSSVYSGAPPGKAAPSIDQRWHHSMFWGLWEVSGPYSLSSACPEGWAEIESHVGVTQAAISLITVGIYVPQTVSVICVAPNAQRLNIPPPPPGLDDQPQTQPGALHSL
jgi:hypothetical protein